MMRYGVKVAGNFNSFNLFSLALEIDLPKDSYIMMKRKGYKGSPCLKPLEELKKPSGVPFTSTENSDIEIHSEIKLI